MAQVAPSGYSRLQIRLHWIVAGLILLQYLFHDGVSDAFDRAQDTGEYVLTAPAIAHFAGGGLILILGVWRLLLRQDRGAPPAPEGEPEIFARLSKWAHLAMYALLVLLPVTGAVAWGGQSEAAGDAHEVLRAVLLLLILTHIAAVAVHQLVWKTGLMTRMVTPEE